MPELPEVEAWLRELDPLVSASPVLQAGPAHIATLKTFDPPLRELEGRRLEGAHRRGKWLLFPTDDGELQLRIHLMSAGRVRHLAPGAKGPKTPAFRLRFENGGELVLTEAGPKKRAGVWLETPEQTEAELAHIGPEALGLGAERLREILAGDNRRLHSLLRDQRALAGIGRAHANEILHRAQLSPFALSSKLDDEEIERLAAAIEEDLTRALELREQGKGDKDVYLVHRRLGEPCPRCGDPLRAGGLRGAHGVLLRALPDRRPRAEGPEDVAPAAVALVSPSSEARRSLGLLARRARALDVDVVLGVGRPAAAAHGVGARHDGGRLADDRGPARLRRRRALLVARQSRRRGLRAPRDRRRLARAQRRPTSACSRLPGQAPRFRSASSPAPASPASTRRR